METHSIVYFFSTFSSGILSFPLVVTGLGIFGQDDILGTNVVSVDVLVLTEDDEEESFGPGIREP